MNAHPKISFSQSFEALPGNTPRLGKNERVLPLPPELLIAFDGLTGPHEVFGACLAGILEAGDLVWFDERIQPRSGDLVAIQLHPDRQRWQAERYGWQDAGPVYSIKRLVKRDGDWLLVADDCPEGFPVGDNIVLGPIIFRLQRPHRADTQGQVERLGKRHAELAHEIHQYITRAKSPAERLMARRQLEQLEKIQKKQAQLERSAIEASCSAPSALPKASCNSVRFGPTTNIEVVDTGEIREEAATETISSLVATIDVNNTTSKLIDTLVVPAQSTDVDCSIDFGFYAAIGAGTVLSIRVSESHTPPPYPSNNSFWTAVFPNTASAQSVNISRQYNFQLAAGGPYTFEFRVERSGSDPASVSVNLSNVYMRIEVIKR